MPRFSPRRLLLWALLCVGIATSAIATPQHGLTPFGELKYGPSFRHFDYVNPNAPKGGRLKLADTASFDNLNAFILKGVPAPGIAMIYDSLMTPSMDEPQAYYGLLASKMEIAPGRASVDFWLRPEARWHDGTPITAEDIAFTLTTLKAKGHPSFRILYEPITEVEIVNPRRVRFHFSDAENRELPILAASMRILPKHYYDTVDFEKTTLKPPLGSGPYRIKKLNQGRSITYERVKDYWGANLPVSIGRFNFDEIHYDIYRDETVSVEAIKSGHYDLREEYIARNWATAYNIDAVERGTLVKKLIQHDIPRGMQAFLFNLRQDKFSDARMREAIGLTMDYEWMNKTLFYGAYKRNVSFFQNTQFEAPSLPDKDELALLEPFRDTLPPELFTAPFAIPTTDGSGFARKNLLKAQALLNEAGWVMKDGKRTNAKTGEVLTVEFMMRQRTFEKVIGSMRKNLARLGIDSSFRFVDDSQYQKRIDDRDFDIISIWWNLGVVFPGNEQISYWHSAQADVVGGNNYSGLKSPVVDSLLSKLTQAQTLEQLTASAHALDRVLLWGHYVIPHWSLDAWRLLYWDKFGQPTIMPTHGLATDSWWMKSAEKKEKHP